MKNTKRNSVSPIPDVFVCLGYKDIYDDYDTVDIDKVIEGIPTMSILNYLVEQHDRVLYALSDVTTQKSQILDFLKYVPTNVKLRIRRFVQRNDKCLIYESYGSLMACGYALRNFTPFDEGDEELGLFYGEFEKVFKLLLYCNQKWIDIQVNGGISQNLIEASLKIDLPVVEFKLYKDFKFQIYKAIPFFKFLESDPYYKQILPIFCADKKVNCWQEYIGRIFNFYAQSLNGHFIKVDTTDLHDNIFFNQYCVNINECSDLQEDHRALNYFRDHFLIDFGNKNYMLLNANLLVDKIYQGIRFDIYKTIETNGIRNKKNKNYNGYPDFSSCIGTDFSEPMLLYSLMTKTFGESCSKLLTGEELKSQGITAEPDLYMRLDNVLFLFEFKDVTLGDKFKYSSDVQAVKTAICERICLLDGEKRKGAGQLHHTINAIIKDCVYDTIDPEVRQVTDIVPIVITTDRAFSAIGVQALVAEEYSKFPTISFEGFISIPIIMEFDTLIDLSYRLNKGFLDFTKVIKKYINEKRSNLQPFSTFVYDELKRERNIITESESEFLFADIIKYM